MTHFTPTRERPKLPNLVPLDLTDTELVDEAERITDPVARRIYERKRELGTDVVRDAYTPTEQDRLRRDVYEKGSIR